MSVVKSMQGHEIERLTLALDAYKKSNADMLEALEASEKWLAGWASAERELATVRAAIAKARGGQS